MSIVRIGDVKIAVDPLLNAVNQLRHEQQLREDENQRRHVELMEALARLEKPLDYLARTEASKVARVTL